LVTETPSYTLRTVLVPSAGSLLFPIITPVVLVTVTGLSDTGALSGQGVTISCGRSTCATASPCFSPKSNLVDLELAPSIGIDRRLDDLSMPASYEATAFKVQDVISSV
jgi:hypothetical protein